MKYYPQLTGLKFCIKWCLIILGTSLVSCLDQIELDLENKDQNLAINGLITNLPEPYFVFIRKAGTYGESIQEEIPVTGAFVQIVSSNGNLVALEEAGNGVYQSNPATFVGQIGIRYQLNVIMPDGRHYVSESEELHAVPPISDLKYNFYEDPYLTAADDISIQKKIDVLVATRVPDNLDNVFFKWDVKGEMNSGRMRHLLIFLLIPVWGRYYILVSFPIISVWEMLPFSMETLLEAIF